MLTFMARGGTKGARIRRATREDLAAIAAIQSASHEASSWEPSSYLDHDCWVAVWDSQIAGFLVSREVGQGEREILNMAVDPSRRRLGIGGMLVRNELARSAGAWFLEVRESNAAAINLYKSLGFSPSGRRKEYYQNPIEAAIVMRIHS
jgi:[ribosomal protein S18]-alanine N-acetyltransferase